MFDCKFSILIILITYIHYFILLQKPLNSSIGDGTYSCVAYCGGFGNQPAIGFEGKFTNVTPYHGCSDLKPTASESVCGKYPCFAVVERNDCTFLNKARNAINASYNGLFVVFPSSSAFTPSSDDTVNTIVLAVNEECGDILRRFAADDGYSFYIEGYHGFKLISILLPFVVVLGLCFVMLSTLVIFRYIRTRRRIARRKLPRRKLRKIPVRKYKSGDKYDSCAICLEDYQIAEKLRVLPCGHAYHCPCIDPWLLNNRKLCPVCKMCVISGKVAKDDNETRETNTAASNNNSNQMSLSTVVTDGDSSNSPTTSGEQSVVQSPVRQGRPLLKQSDHNHGPTEEPIASTSSSTSISHLDTSGKTQVSGQSRNEQDETYSSNWGNGLLSVIRSGTDSLRGLGRSVNARIHHPQTDTPVLTTYNTPSPPRTDPSFTDISLDDEVYRSTDALTANASHLSNNVVSPSAMEEVLSGDNPSYMV